MSTPEERAAEVLAEHEPTYTDRATDPTRTFYCRPCSEERGDWVTWTPEHAARALAAANLLTPVVEAGQEREAAVLAAERERADRVHRMLLARIRVAADLAVDNARAELGDDVADWLEKSLHDHLRAALADPTGPTEGGEG